MVSKTGDLRAALARAIHDPTLRLAFPTPDGDGYVDPAGRPGRGCPPEVHARGVTRVVSADRHHRSARSRPGCRPALVDSAVAASRFALENERLTAELRAQLDEVRASRARIVAATDEERRRLERDLHDGAQQRLVALGFTLRRASRALMPIPSWRVLLDEANRELEDGLRELRALARGIHPTALPRAAWRPPFGSWPTASRSQSRSMCLPSGCHDAIESTAYFIVTEALTNVLRHAQATQVPSAGASPDDALDLEIADDGRGGADDGAGGSGVRGLMDRAQAVGGTLSIDSPADGGTTIRARPPAHA